MGHGVKAMRRQATVIIPCHNVEAYIQECLDSVLLQGDVVHHTFVVDNNSTDSTISQVKAWHNANPNFALTISEEKKPGAPAARNHPLSQIETKWIQFLDADDLLIEGKIADQIQKFPQADVICAASKHLAIDGTERNSFPEPNIPLALMKGSAGITSSNLFYTSAIIAVEGWDESLKSSQEYDLMFRLWKSGTKFETDLIPRAIIRERPSGQISQRDPTEKWVQLLTLREEMFSTMVSLDEKIITDEQQFCQAIFDQIRTLAKFNRKEAMNFYERVFENKSFKPTSNAVNSKLYIVVFNLFGFQVAETIKNLVAYLLEKKHWCSLTIFGI